MAERKNGGKRKTDADVEKRIQRVNDRTTEIERRLDLLRAATEVKSEQK
jgi:hypothetical protein